MPPLASRLDLHGNYFDQAIAIESQAYSDRKYFALNGLEQRIQCNPQGLD
jgi:hypothetical protein